MLIAVRAGGIFLAVAFVAAILYVRGVVQSLRGDIITNQHRLERRLEGASRQSRLRAELLERGHDIDRLQAFLTQRGNFGNVIGWLETEAGRLGVEIRIPDVIEGENEGSHEVRMEVTVTGDPQNVLQFMRKAEHIPYLARIDSFSFFGRSGSAAASSVALPQPAAGNSRDEESSSRDALVSIPARLVFTMIVITRP